MPELPEVETFRRYLLQGNDGSPSILGKKIRDADLLWSGSIASPTPNEFLERIKGQFITGIGRRGKNLLIRLSRDTLIIHLRMSGELIVEKQSEPRGKHYRVIINFDDKYRMAFNNIRKFGRIWLTDNPQEQLGNLGPEPLSDDFTVEDLHLTQILWDSIREVLKEGIKNQGSSIDWMYRGGDYQNYLSVYNLEGEPCKTCKTPVACIKIAQRSTYFCPTCQSLPE